MSKYMEIIDIRNDRDCKTGVGAAFKTDAETRRAFDSIRAIEVPKDAAEFLVDLHDDNGDLTDTILIDGDGFRALTGQRPPTPEESGRFDRAYWRDAMHYRELRRSGSAGVQS